MAADGEALIFRPADPTDNADPSGTFARRARCSATPRDRLGPEPGGGEAALGVLRHRGRVPAAGARADRQRRPSCGPAEIAVVGVPQDERTGALDETALDAARRSRARPGDGSQPMAPRAACPCSTGAAWRTGALAADARRQSTCQAPASTRSS